MSNSSKATVKLIINVIPVEGERQKHLRTKGEKCNTRSNKVESRRVGFDLFIYTILSLSTETQINTA